MNNPPGLSRYVLQLVSHQSEREALLGDLEEDFVHIAVTSGDRAARRWYRMQAVKSVLPMLGARLRRARLQFTARGSGGGFRMEHLRQDIVYGVRSLIRRPGYAVSAILTLAIAIGANTAIFSVVNGLFFKGVPGVDEKGLLNISRDLNGEYFDMSWPMTDHLTTSSQTLAELAVIFLTPLAVSKSIDEDPAVHLGAAVSSNYLRTLGLTPSHGRFFQETEDYPSAGDVAVISHALWRSLFRGAPDVLGSPITINGYPLRIVGVTPEGFNGPAVGVRMDVYVPLGVGVAGLPKSESLSRWNAAQVEVIGRLAPGQSISRARAELTALAVRADAERQPSGQSRFRVRVEEWTPVPAPIRVGVTVFFSVLLTVVGVLLCMACLNVTNMLLSQSVQRKAEFSIRLALGASRSRLVRQLLTEAALLFALAASLGVLIAVWLSGLLLTFQPPLPPGFVIDLDLGLDWRVLGFCGVVAGASCLLFSLTPSFRATRLDLSSSLQRGHGDSHTRARLRSTMIAAQMAGTTLLLIVAGLFVRSLRNMTALDTGWDADGVYVAQYDLNLSGMTDETGSAFFDGLIEHVRSIPGVRSAGWAAKLPLAGGSSYGLVNVRGVDPPPDLPGFRANLNRVSNDYFESVALDIVQGSDFPARVAGAQRVALVNETMARRLWPGRSAVGETFYIGDVATGTAVEVIGVVEDAKYRRLVEQTPNFYYLSHQQYYDPQLVLHVNGDEAAIASITDQLRTATRELAPALAVPELRMLEHAVGVFLLPQKIAAFVAGAMGVVGLLLGLVGVYGVTSFVVGQRRREIGVRIALGADNGRVVRGMMGRGLVPSMVGMVIGVALAAVFSQVAGSFLGGVGALDPVTFGGALGILSLASVVATLIPTARAVRADPVVVLRAE